MVTKPNISRLLKSHKNQWVALSPDYRRVVSSGRTLRSVVGKIRGSQRDRLIFHRVLPKGYEPPTR